MSFDHTRVYTTHEFWSHKSLHHTRVLITQESAPHTSLTWESCVRVLCGVNSCVLCETRGWCTLLYDEDSCHKSVRLLCGVDSCVLCRVSHKSLHHTRHKSLTQNTRLSHTSVSYVVCRVSCVVCRVSCVVRHVFCVRLLCLAWCRLLCLVWDSCVRVLCGVDSKSCVRLWVWCRLVGRMSCVLCESCVV